MEKIYLCLAYSHMKLKIIARILWILYAYTLLYPGLNLYGNRIVSFQINQSDPHS